MHNGNYKLIGDHCISTKEKNKVSPCTFSSIYQVFMMMLSVAIIATLVAVSHVEGADFTMILEKVYSYHAVLFNFTDNSIIVLLSSILYFKKSGVSNHSF